ncbi:hypothetical protein [Komagataeibacter medellinensis]|uniref:DNA primase n=1 Tax=Komagataeibacter medellinensis (strain NBRC 3288 / BCRC 11682 / LMG 1693 / Kondo 51) TaxID=634177 RepID=G2I7G4_KOMMN|nr:hypothetical protein [Komagataeibacter medellinensis]BAK84061.1 hypothetical protein GLX_16490 [Komagataeibacter medellinensis NBRC 3288]
MSNPSVDFARINSAALASLPALLGRWLPDGKREGHEWVARNPRRSDREPGSFKVNMNTCRWSDFATGDRGGDPVSLAAYLFNIRQGEAASRLVAMLGLGG